MTNCKIIAEIGVNHNGDINLAKDLILCAKRAGADFVKFQTYKTEYLVMPNAQCAAYQNNSNQYEMLKQYELTNNEFKELAEFARNTEITFISTPFDCESVDLLEEINVPLYKISSSDINNFILLDKIKKTGKPIIISTGMSNLDDITNTLLFLDGSDVTIMHCTSAYPTDIDDINLSCINTLKNLYNVKVGLSDHSELCNEIAFMAVALGAVYVEKHMTLDHNMIGPDHKASMNPTQFFTFVNCVNFAKRIMGNGVKKCINNVNDVKKVTKRGVCAKHFMDKDTILTFDNIISLRGNDRGIPVENILSHIGKKIVRSIESFESIQLNDLI